MEAQAKADDEDGVEPDFVYNWDNKLRSAKIGANDVINAVKYDPDGNRVYKEIPGTPVPVKRKYIVDIVGRLPVILIVMDAGNNNSVVNTYVYANSQVLAQYEGEQDSENDKHFYLHDRLGSVRLMIDESGDVSNYYTYTPFGRLIEDSSDWPQAPSNDFMFTGQWYDSEIDQYYLRARQYDPEIIRFTGRDFVEGKFEKPMTLHVYIYCRNEPVNYRDLNGLWTDGIRYALREGDVPDAFSLSDEEIRDEYPDIWRTSYETYKGSIWHGHSDFGYHLGDFDYTVLDHERSYRPLRDWPGGTWYHFRPLEGVFGAELFVDFAIRSGDVDSFQKAMHMGQDYFSHYAQGWRWPLGHARAPDGGHAPDNPYITGGAAKRHKSAAYKSADRWTKQKEELWYLFWDPDIWMRL